MRGRSLSTSRLEECDFDSLPPALRRKYFSSLERLRLAQDGSLPTGPEKRLRRHSPRSKSSLRNAPSCHDHQLSSLGRSPSQRLRRTQSIAVSSLALQAETEWFWSLPSKVQQTHFSREEQVLFAGTCESVIFDAADESLLRLKQQLNTCSDNASISDVSCNMELLEVLPMTPPSPAIESPVEMDNGLFSGFRWDDERDEQDLGLDEYHTAIADTVDIHPTPGKCRPTFRRHLSAGSIQFHYESSPYRKLSKSGRTASALPPSSTSHTRTGSTFRVPRHKAQTSVSSIDPTATHYRDPEARLKLRVYLASPQKFDEAIEFGFPSIEKKEKSPHSRPATGPRLTWESDRSFYKDEADSLFEDGPCTNDDVSVTDSESPRTPQDSVFQSFSVSDGSSSDTHGNTRALLPRKMSEAYTHASAGKREMTLHMTLTRPDLRTEDGRAAAIADQPLHITTLPFPREHQSIWDTLPSESSMVKRFWRKIKKT